MKPFSSLALRRIEKAVSLSWRFTLYEPTLSIVTVARSTTGVGVGLAPSVVEGVGVGVDVVVEVGVGVAVGTGVG